MLKSSRARGTSAITGKVASTTGTAPRRPAQPRIARSGHEKCENSVAGITASGRATTAATIASTVPSTAMSPQLRREHEQAEREEHAELRDPRQALVEGGDRLLGGDRAGAEHQPGEVDREEARAVQRVGAAEGQRGRRQRGDRVEPGGRELRAPEALDRGPADGEADDEADAELLDEQHHDVVEAVAGLRDRLDQRDHQQHGDGVVEAGLALERARQAPAQRRVAQQGEDRGAVRGGEHRADQQALLERRSRTAAPPSTPEISAHSGVAISASETEVPSTGRISITPEVRPPSNRISASATTPTVRARS